MLVYFTSWGVAADSGYAVLPDEIRKKIRRALDAQPDETDWSAAKRASLVEEDEVDCWAFVEVEGG